MATTAKLTVALLQRWLTQCAAVVKAGPSANVMGVVLGNEAAGRDLVRSARRYSDCSSGSRWYTTRRHSPDTDLDSVVSTVTYSFFRDWNGSAADLTPPKLIPVINVARHEFRLRTEATYLFRRLG